MKFKKMISLTNNHWSFFKMFINLEDASSMEILTESMSPLEIRRQQKFKLDFETYRKNNGGEFKTTRSNPFS